MSKDNGGPAFPHEYKFGDGTAQRSDGMTLRDYFAASMGNGVVSIDMLRSCKTVEECEAQITNAAALAYKLADAMLKARDK